MDEWTEGQLKVPATQEGARKNDHSKGVFYIQLLVPGTL